MGDIMNVGDVHAPEASEGAICSELAGNRVWVWELMFWTHSNRIWVWYLSYPLRTQHVNRPS